MLRRLVVAGLAVLSGLLLTSVALADDDDPDRGHPERIPIYKVQRFSPQPAGTQEHQRWWFGPYTIPQGHDMNRVDLDLPTQSGFIISVAPHLRRAADITEPSHQEGHIHHAHWFRVDPGNEEDTYTYGNSEWIFGTGDEESHANFADRSAADPKGPIYGQFIEAANPQTMIYMLHNKTSAPMEVYIVLDVDFVHGTKAELDKAGREYHDISGVLFGRTFDVPRVPLGDGIFRTSRMKQGPIEWTATHDGTMVGTGGHLHPGGLSVIVENLGPKENPCPHTGVAEQGTLLLRSDANPRNGVKFSEDFVMEGTDPAWRAPIRKGDRIRITGLYENKDHAWYTAMTHEGVYVDEAQPPVGRCSPYLINKPTPQGKMTRVRKKVKVWVSKKVRVKRNGKYVKRHGKYVTKTKRVRVTRLRWVKKKLPGKPLDPTEGVLLRPFGKHIDRVCGHEYGALPCDKPVVERPPGQFASTVTINNFLYTPGDMSLSGDLGNPVQVHQGQSLTFYNADEAADIRHSITTCAYPCNGPYVANYPLADGRWDSGTLGYDLIDGGSPNPMSSTPTDLPQGKYAYFCRIHPWMRGEFDVVP
jgi:plastocyanin